VLPREADHVLGLDAPLGNGDELAGTYLGRVASAVEIDAALVEELGHGVRRLQSEQPEWPLLGSH
jgi:hypothetical protein